MAEEVFICRANGTDWALAATLNWFVVDAMLAKEWTVNVRRAIKSRARIGSLKGPNTMISMFLRECEEFGFTVPK
jgi:hypothetical protein